MADASTPAKKRARSTPYPAYGLEKAIANIKTLEENLGHGPFSRESAAKALGYSSLSGSSGKAVAALAHYGLLARTGDTYEISEITEKIMRWKDESERLSAIRQAASQPKLFQRLLDTYSGKSVPSMLSHILAREHKIGANVASEVVKTFEDTMTYAGYLRNGVIVDPGSSTPNDSDSQEKPPLKDADTTGQGHGKRDEHVNTSPNMQSMDIVPGVVLLYDSKIAFDLFTNAEFVSALYSLKQQAEAKRDDND